MAKHFEVTITDTNLTTERKQAQIDAEARLDGIYVIRTPVTAEDLDAAGTVTAYKALKHVGRDFGTSSPTTSTCARSSTGSSTASRGTC